MGRLRKLHVFLCFIFVARFLPSSAEGENYCWEKERDAGLCCTCTMNPHTLRCRDTCPPYYFPSVVLKPILCTSQPIVTTDDYVPITSEPQSNVSADNHSASTNIQEDLQATYNVCVLCDEACSGCTGSGPAQCNSCAEGYSRTSDPLEQCTENRNELDLGLVVGASVGGVVLIVIVLVALLLCRLRQRRLHKRDPQEPPQILYDPASNRTARQDIVEEKMPKNTFENTSRYARPLSIERGYDKVTRYTRDPTAKILNPRHGDMIPDTVTEEESGNASKPYESIQILPEQLLDTSGSSVGDFQTDGEGDFLNTAVITTNPELRRSAKRKSQRPSDSAAYERIGGAISEPNENNKPEEEAPRDSGMGDSLCSQRSSHLYKNIDMEVPLFSKSWQFSKRFSADGGRLQVAHSDVCLKIPKGAVSREASIIIYGSVCTDLTTVHCLVSLPKNESIASPVVEYGAANSNFQSRVPMCITLPHFINRLVSHDTMKVYCLRRRNDSDGYCYEQLRFVEKGDLKKAVANTEFKESAGVYYFDKKNIYIRTAHFSGYVCTDCDTEFKPPEIQAEIHTKYNLASRLMEVRLDLWDNRFNIKDFKENRPDKDSASFAGMILRDVKTLGALKEEDVKAIGVGTSLTVAQEAAQMWVHKQHNGNILFPPANAIPVTDLMHCTCSGRARVPRRLDWNLTKAATNAPAAAGDDDDNATTLECLVEVGYIKYSEHEDFSTPLPFLRRPNPVKFLISIKPLESATVANVSGPPMVNIERADLVNFSASSTGDQTHCLRQKPRNPASRASSHVYQNLGFPDHPPTPDSNDT